MRSTYDSAGLGDHRRCQHLPANLERTSILDQASRNWSHHAYNTTYSRRGWTSLRKSDGGTKSSDNEDSWSPIPSLIPKLQTKHSYQRICHMH